MMVMMVMMVMMGMAITASHKKDADRRLVQFSLVQLGSEVSVGQESGLLWDRAFVNLRYDLRTNKHIARVDFKRFESV